MKKEEITAFYLDMRLRLSRKHLSNLLTQTVIVGFTGKRNRIIDEIIHVTELLIEELSKDEPDEDIVDTLLSEGERLEAKLGIS